MKTSNKILLAVAAGLAVSGLTIYFLNKEKGAKLTANWKEKAKGMAKDIEDLVEKARHGVSELKAQVVDQFQCAKEVNPEKTTS